MKGVKNVKRIKQPSVFGFRKQHTHSGRRRLGDGTPKNEQKFGLFKSAKIKDWRRI